MACASVQRYIIAFIWLPAACPAICLTYHRCAVTAIAPLSINKKSGNTRDLCPQHARESMEIWTSSCPLAQAVDGSTCFWKALVGKRDHGSWRSSLGCLGTWIWEWPLLGVSKPPSKVAARRKAVRLGIRVQCFGEREKNSIRWSKTNLLLCWCEAVLVSKRSKVRNMQEWPQSVPSAAFLVMLLTQSLDYTVRKHRWSR